MAAVILAGCSSGGSDPQPTEAPVASPTASRTAPPIEGDALPPVPDGLSERMELGIANRDGELDSFTATAPFGYRYQYLTGPADAGWTKWTHVWSGQDEDFLRFYIYESEDAGAVPVFTYYVLLQSTPEGGSEGDRVAAGLQDAALMRTYFEGLERFFREAGEATAEAVILHVEPDLWGFLQSRAIGDVPATVPAAVASTGLDTLEGLPDTAVGFAQGIVRLRDQLAPNVLLALHASTWATGDDFIYDDPDDAAVSGTGTRIASFLSALGGGWDLVFAEFSDRDAGFKEAQYGDHGTSWFAPGDFRRHALFVETLVRETGLRAMLWQIPLGNTVMRAMDNTWNHYQDNRVQWLLDDPSGAHLDAYAAAGVIGLLFGRGADGATDIADSAEDGLTNPQPINGNVQTSYSADDDGGYFRMLAARYYGESVLALP
jgi:hypothetical protein